MDRLRIYLDTSVFGGYFDTEFEHDSRKLFEFISTEQVGLVVSDLTSSEIDRAPNHVRHLLKKTSRLSVERVEITAEAVELQEAYLRAAILGRRWQDDALHIALATIARVDALVSWNFKHMLDPRRMRGFNSVNLSQGFGLVTIVSPTDLVGYLERK